MENILYEKDSDISVLKNCKVGIIGYGSQGHAHALNLRESGIKVSIGLKKNSQSRVKALNDGFKVFDVDTLVKRSNFISLLIPDQLQKKVYLNSIVNNIKSGDTLLFAHGFNIRYEYINPPSNINVILVAPKGPGHIVRREYTAGRGVPSLIAVHQDITGNSKELALSYAKGIGSTKAGVIQTSFKEETETDLFGEQSVLCGGVSHLIQSGFEVLVESGYKPEIAYFEVLHELKLIVDLIIEGGISKQRWSVSDTAEYGDYVSGPKIIDNHVKRNMRDILKNIQNGNFAKNFMQDQENGGKKFKQLRSKYANHQIEIIGSKLRKLFHWSSENKNYDDYSN